MKVNLVNNLADDKSSIDKLFNFNMVVAWNLRKAFKKRGVETRFVRDNGIKREAPPKADHTLVISANAIRHIRNVPGYHKKLRNSTKGKLTLYLDADFASPSMQERFDIIFTVIKPHPSPKYVYGGWGADPKFFYPEHKERAIFLDSLMYGKYNDRFNNIYDIYKSLLKVPEKNLKSGDLLITKIPDLKLTLYMPVPSYNKRFNIIYWPQIQKIIRKCHYYCCTQLGESGLTRLESATCGGLLVVPRPLYRPRTMDSLEHKIWDTKEDLIKILKAKTNVKAIRKKALVHNWNKVASRMITAWSA